MTTTTARPAGRGEGMTYEGSVEAARGAIVSTMWDCDCRRCGPLDPWDENRRVIARLEDGRTLLCARASSFTRRKP